MSAEAILRAEALAGEPLRPAGPTAGLAKGTTRSVRELWAHRELLGLLVRRELKARYKDSVLGFFWSLMRPLTLLLIYYIAVGKFLNAEDSIPDFAIYIFTGLTAWNLFNEIMISGTSSIVANSGLVKKVYLPLEVFPLATVGSALFNFSVQLVILAGAILIASDPPTAQALVYVPLSFLVMVVFATALTMVLSAVNVYLRDVQYLVEIMLMILFWASPIVYSWEQVRGAVSPVLAEIYLANPVTLAVIGFQQGFWSAGSDEPVPPHLTERLGITLAVSLLLLWVGQRVFARLQGNFAQEL